MLFKCRLQNLLLISTFNFTVNQGSIIFNLALWITDRNTHAFYSIYGTFCINCPPFDFHLIKFPTSLQWHLINCDCSNASCTFLSRQIWFAYLNLPYYLYTRDILGVSQQSVYNRFWSNASALYNFIIDKHGYSCIGCSQVMQFMVRIEFGRLSSDDKTQPCDVHVNQS